MTSKKGERFDETVQFNADKRYVEFIFNSNQSKQQSQQHNSSSHLVHNKNGEYSEEKNWMMRSTTGLKWGKQFMSAVL